WAVLPPASNLPNTVSRSCHVRLVSTRSALDPWPDSSFRPHARVVAHSRPSAAPAWYVTDAETLETSSRGAVPSPASASVSFPADTCNATFDVGRNQKRPENESSAPKSKYA